ncbi:MAG: hypothetical protein M3076_09950 [Actinomycetota bacterium]|nr:hypothetical protein [Actinomycetota bacterium]
MRRTSQPPSGRGTVRATGVARAWQALAPDRRLAALAAVGLFVTLFLPWYQETVIATGRAATLEEKSVALTGWGAFSFVEAAVLLVAGGVVTLLYKRAQGRAFHLPGGDGAVITAAGAWTSLLIVWRIFDKQGTQVTGPGATTSGVEWGIFVALGVAALLVYAGSRIRAANQPEPPLPGEDEPARGRDDVTRRGRRARSPRPVPAGGQATERIVRDPTARVTRDPRFGPSIVPEDPPTLRLERTDRGARGTAPSSPAQPTPPRQKSSDEQLTIPLEDEGFEGR